MLSKIFTFAITKLNPLDCTVSNIFYNNFILTTRIIKHSIGSARYFMWFLEFENQAKSSHFFDCEKNCTYLNSSLHRVYKVINFLAKSLASINPSATNMISQISAKSGTTIAQGLKSAFKFSGSSVLPA